MIGFILLHINPEGDNTPVAVLRTRDRATVKRLVEKDFDTTWAYPPEDGYNLMFERYDDGQQVIRILRDGDYEDENDGVFLLQKTTMVGFD